MEERSIHSTREKKSGTGKNLHLEEKYVRKDEN